MAVNTYGVREVADLIFYDLKTNKPFLYIPYALTNSNEHKSQVTYARGGKYNPKRLAFDGERESTFKISTQLIDFRIISMLAGADVSSGETNVFKREELVVVDNASNLEVTLSQTPIADSISVFAIAEDAETGKEFVNATDYTVAGNVVTITKAGVNADDKVAVYYQFTSAATAEKVSFTTDNFPVTCKIVGETIIKNEATGENEPFQMVVYKAKPLADFTLDMASEGEPAKFEMNFELLADTDNKFIDYIKY